MVNRIILNETSYHGAGAVQSITAELAARGLRKPIVFSDPDLIRFGVTKKVTDILDAAKVPYAIYSEIKPNPTIENVKNGVKAFKKAKADTIIAIGGGSSMDTAKAVGIIMANPEFADVRSLALADARGYRFPMGRDARQAAATGAFRFAKTNLRARSEKSRRIERPSVRRARGSTSTSQNRLRSLRRWRHPMLLDV